MRVGLGIPCDDERKLKNAFAELIKRYTDVKAKLNSSGFGIDPQKDATLDKGEFKTAVSQFDLPIF